MPNLLHLLLTTSQSASSWPSLVHQFPLILGGLFVVLMAILLIRKRRKKPSLWDDVKTSVVYKVNPWAVTRQKRPSGLAMIAGTTLVLALTSSYSLLIYDTRRFELVAQYSNYIVLGFVLFFIFAVYFVYKR